MAQGSTTDDAQGPQRLSMLASALAGRTVTVASGGPGEPAYTDGVTVYVDPTAVPQRQLDSVSVQASLLAAGAFAPDILRKLLRRPKLASRYLAIEGHRALAANDELLPPAVRRLVDLDLATSVDSPSASLTLAGTHGSFDPPDSFGVIKARSLLAAVGGSGDLDPSRTHVPRRNPKRDLPELDDEDDVDGPDVPDLFSSPAGGNAVVGKLLQRLMSRVRRLSGGGPPGADSATHRSGRGMRGAASVISAASSLSDLEAPDDAARGRKYPEWDTRRRRYRPDWCTVHEIHPPLSEKPLPRPDVHALRRPLTRLGIGLDRCHRQSQGVDLDIDAAVESRVEVLAGSAPDEAVYLDNLRRRRDLAVLILLDISGSVAESAMSGQPVHELQRAAAAALTVALHELGDRVALYAFSSQGRTAVNLVPVKRFDGALDAAVLRRLGALTPGAYSRLGAAIRHGSAVVSEQGGTARRLLVVLSDGLAYDHGYERTYGAADARRALGEARRAGIGCLCLTIGAATDTGELRRVFGSAAHAAIPKPTQVSDVIGPLFRAALRTADLRRRVS